MRPYETVYKLLCIAMEEVLAKIEEESTEVEADYSMYVYNDALNQDKHLF